MDDLALFENIKHLSSEEEVLDWLNNQGKTAVVSNRILNMWKDAKNPPTLIVESKIEAIPMVETDDVEKSVKAIDTEALNKSKTKISKIFRSKKKG